MDEESQASTRRSLRAEAAASAHSTRSPASASSRPRGESEGSGQIRWWMLLAAVVAGALVGGAGYAITQTLGGEDASGGAAAASPSASATAESAPPIATEVPSPSMQEAVTPEDICANTAVTDAVAAGDDAAVIAAAGGAAPFRAAIAAGAASCISLSDPAREWLVVNKQRPLDPLDFAPTLQGNLEPRAAAALTALMQGALDAGVGEVGINNGYRSYSTQVSTYNGHVGRLGQEQADTVSARPGHSEHQTGFALDAVACGSGCGGLDDFGPTSQGQWVAENGWRYGFIVRYEEGYTPVSGYSPEPWHLRYIGPELAALYKEGRWRTLENFFNLPPAPTY